MAKRARSTGKKIDDAFKEVEKMRELYGLGHLDGPSAVDGQVLDRMSRVKPMSYHADANRLRNALRTVEDGLGRVPRGKHITSGGQGR